MSTDEVTPGTRWEFDTEVTDAFDDMLARSIPEYETMRESATSLATSFARERTSIVDLGCARGEALARVIDHLGPTWRASFVGVETSTPMYTAASERFADDKRVAIYEMDLRRAYPLLTGTPLPFASVTLAVLTLQFIPIEYRQRIVAKIRRTTVSGGVLILVEKILGDGAEIDDVMVAHYYRHKRAEGYSTDQVERKRLALEGVLVPVTAEWNIGLLRRAGFTEIDCFWRWMNFAGWVAIAP